MNDSISSVSRAFSANCGTKAGSCWPSCSAPAGGLFGEGMLVSYKRLTDDQKNRLKANGLAYCDGSGLKDLRQRIEPWI